MKTVKRILFNCAAFSVIAIPYVASADAENAPSLAYLLDADPDRVTAAQLEEYAAALHASYWADHQVHGIGYARIWAELEDAKPSRYGSGGDSALFTGFQLAAETYRFLVTQEAGALDSILATLRGIHILTHITGTPGVLVRCAIPADDRHLWNYEDRWRNRVERGDVYSFPAGRVSDVLNPEQSYPAMIAYARTSRDQLTGILFGLAVVWHELTPERFEGVDDATATIHRIRSITQTIIDALWSRLEQEQFIIRDHTGRRYRSSSKVAGMLRLQLLGLYRARLQADGAGSELDRIETMYARAWRKAFRFGAHGSWNDLFNRFSRVNDYYAWNLRYTRAFTVWLLEPDAERRELVRAYVASELWPHVRTHQNAHFTFLHAAMQPSDSDELDDGVRALKSWTLRPRRSWDSPLAGEDHTPSVFHRLFCDVGNEVVPPHLRAPTHYFIWQKDPFDVDQSSSFRGLRRSTGIDFLLPYWFARYYALLESAEAADRDRD